MILLVDGNNVAFVSNSVGSLSTKEGFPTQAISNFLKNVRSYIGLFDPDKIFVAWDGGKSKKRMALHPTYKSSRALDKKTPEQKMNFEELLLQMPIIKQAVADLGLYSLSGPGIEGDDLIALMTKRAEHLAEDAVIISSDSDFHQLISERVSVYGTMAQQKKAKKPRHVTLSNFSEAHDGLKPEQYLQFKALQGDSSDDIPGVKGIGPVYARKLLVEFGSPEQWMEAVAHGWTKTNRTTEKIIARWEDYEMSKAMIDLHNPLGDFSTARIDWTGPNFKAVREMALKYQINDIFIDFSTWVRPFKGLR